VNKPVITGQQIGLLGGPLYTTYKVLGAVNWSQKIKGKPIYWLETNDADFNEINHFTYLDAAGQLQTLTWDIHSQGYSCGFIEVDDSLITLLNTFFSTLRQTEFTPVLRNMALRCYSKGKKLSEASEQLAHELFGSLGVNIFNPMDITFRTFSKDILLKEAARTQDDQQCNLFCMIGKQRKAVFKRSGTFYLRDGTSVDLWHHDLVPNVRTRNICQDAYFNTHTYIAGPGEIKYISDLDSFYSFYGVIKPQIKPRMSLTLIEPKVKRLLGKLDIVLSDVLNVEKDRFISQTIEEKSGYNPKKILHQVNDLTEDYIKKLSSFNFELSELKSIRKNLLKEVKDACGSLRLREKEKSKQLLNDIGYLSDSLVPRGQKQERVFNIFYYMNLYGGIDFIKRVYSEYDFEKKTLEI
jgi:uncharacterized protein YllA (UPF0747 family)